MINTHRMVRIAVGMAALVALAGVVSSAQEPADVSGDWALTVVTDLGGTTNPSVTLEQDGTALTGHYSSAALGEADVTGTVNGNDFTFGFSADAQGQSLDVVYEGSLRDDGTIAGEMDLGGLGGGPFTGERR